MAAVFEKIKDFLGLEKPEDYGYEYDDDSYDIDQDLNTRTKAVDRAEEDVPTTTQRSNRLFGGRFNSSSSAFDFSDEQPVQAKSETRRESRETTKEGARKMVDVTSSGLRLVLCKPTEFENCQGICSHLRAQMTIVLNLQYVANAADRKRIFDFVSGCCYALDGNIQKVADLIYVIAPCNVDVFAEVAEAEKEASEAYDYDNIF